MVLIGVLWLAVGIRKWRATARRRQAAWVKLISEFPLEAKTSGRATEEDSGAEADPRRPGLSDDPEPPG
jgi:hypothetical protein